MPTTLSLRVNGRDVVRDVEPNTLLVTFIREHLQLTGTHVGCDTAQCGACTVHLDGHAVKSCNMLALQAAGREVTTIEGIATADGTMHPMQAAFKECHGLQCGFCTPGMVMSAIDLVANHAENAADDRRIREALVGNFCRCTGYQNIVKAVQVGGAGHEVTGRIAIADSRVPRRRNRRRPTASPERNEERHWVPACAGTTRSRTHECTSRLHRPVGQAQGRPALPDRRGQYTDDVALPQQTLRRLRALAARARDDRRDRHRRPRWRRPACSASSPARPRATVGGLPCGWLINNPDGTPMKEPKHPVLATARCATSATRSRWWSPRRSTRPSDAAAARRGRLRRAAAGRRHRDREGRAVGGPRRSRRTTSATTWGCGDKAGVDAAFATAPHVSRARPSVNNRLIPNAMEPRAANAQLRPVRRELHALRREPEPARRAAADVRLRARPARAPRCASIAPDVGGGFGSKIFLYAEETCAGLGVASASGRPIKWTADRSESFLSDAHGRDHVTTVELATDDATASFLALRVHTIANLGAYLSTFASACRRSSTRRCSRASTRRRRSTPRSTAVFTNTAPVDAYRGAGRPEATYLVERIVETARARAEHRPGRDPSPQLHHDVPVRDAGRAHLRHRRLRRDA